MDGPTHGQDSRTARWASFAALGVVFGDLGTSPLYTLQTVVQATGGHFTPRSAFGHPILDRVGLDRHDLDQVLPRSDARRQSRRGRNLSSSAPLIGANGFTRGFRMLTCMGLLGAALIYGDAVITPAISVLSALEGLERGGGLVQVLHHADGGVHSRRTLCRAAIRDGEDRACLRSGDAGVVSGHRRAGGGRHRSSSRRHRGSGPALRSIFCGYLGQRGISRPRRRISVHHGRRGAVRGYGTFRQNIDSPLLVCHRVAGVAAELCGSDGLSDGPVDR